MNELLLTDIHSSPCTYPHLCFFKSLSSIMSTFSNYTYLLYIKISHFTYIYLNIPKTPYNYTCFIKLALFGLQESSKGDRRAPKD